MNKIFYLAAACITDHQNRLLLVRKKGTKKFMLPEGKIKQGETPICTLIRELKEEIELTINKNEAVYLNTYRAPAANEPDYNIESILFRIKLDHSPILSPASEIDEARWVSLEQINELNLAPLIKTYIIPLWQQL